MNWSAHLRAFRRHRGLTQAAFAELLGVEQATVSRWETGALRPSLRIQARLREITGVIDSRSDRAILSAVRFSGALCSLVRVDEPRFVAVSDGYCRLNGIAHEALLARPFVESVSVQAARAVEDRALVNALVKGDVLALRITDRVPHAGGGAPHLIAATVVPLFLSDGTCVMRVDSTLVQPESFDGPAIRALTEHDLA